MNHPIDYEMYDEAESFEEVENFQDFGPVAPLSLWDRDTANLFLFG